MVHEIFCFIKKTSFTKKLNFFLSNPNCDKTEIVTKRQNSNWDKTQEQKLWQNLKLKLRQTLTTQIVTKCKYSNYDKTKNLKLQQKSNSNQTK